MQGNCGVTRWRRSAGFGCLALCLGLAACQRSVPPAVEPTQVLAIRATTADGATGALPATIQARYHSDLSFRIAGQLVSRAVHVGDRVRKGQILARLDDADATAQQAAAKAGMQAAAHKLLFAGQQLQRDQALMAQDLIARTQFEQTQDSFAAASAGQRQAAAQLKQAQDNLGYQVLRAEHDGLITAENAEAGATVAAGQVVYGLDWLPELDVELNVGASELANWPRGKIVRLQATELPGLVFEAEVREVAGHEDSQSGSYGIKLTLQKPDGRLRPGMTATVMTGAKQGGVRIPVGALFHQGEKPAVWVITAGSSQLQLRAVTVSGYQASQVLISQGLSPGEWVVAAGVHNVHEGEKVKPAIAPENIFDSARARSQS
jgi:membrane fusion protein, multidrug efflux system